MGNMFFFLIVLLILGVIEHRGRFPPKGESSVTTLIKIPCNKVDRGKIITKVMGHVLQDEY